MAMVCFIVIVIVCGLLIWCCWAYSPNSEDADLFKSFPLDITGKRNCDAERIVVLFCNQYSWSTIENLYQRRLEYIEKNEARYKNAEDFVIDAYRMHKKGNLYVVAERHKVHIDYFTLKEKYLGHCDAKIERQKMTTTMRNLIKERDNYTCRCCGKQMFDGVGLQIDHIVPVSKGGKTVPENLQVLCSNCNLRKSNKTGSPSSTKTSQVGFEQLMDECFNSAHSYCVITTKRSKK